MWLLYVLVSIFVLFAWSRALHRFRERKIQLNQFIFWTIIWTGILCAVFFQGWTVWLSSLLGIGRGSDLIVYVSVVLLFYLLFRLYVKTEKIEQEITKITSYLAIERAKISKKK
ncbi:MAG: DUF2304 family protein [Candidatus Woesearchaeota archaeon]